MLKFSFLLCFVLAAVAGDWPPQDHGYNQMRFPGLPTPPYPEPVQVSSPQSGLPVAMPRARPCRRRNFGAPGVSPDSGWAPAPVTQPLFESQLVQPQFKPQSLTENRAPATDDNNEAENSHPNKSVEKNSNPTYFTGNHNFDDSEKNKDSQNPSESEKSDKNVAPHTHVEDEHYHHHHHHTGGDREDQHEHSPDSHECEMHGNADKHENHDESEHDADDNGKAAPVDVHEEAVKLISKCVQDAKEDKSEEVLQGESRRSNPSDSKKNAVVISPKLKPMGSARDEDSNVNNVQSSSVLDRLDPQVYNPAKDAGKLQGNAKVSLLQNGRVCYACSTYFDSSCWRPNATTTVKYCLKNNNACITKTFKVAGKTILTRDCGNTCNQDDPYGMGPKHTSCSMCHTDMCNSAYTIHGLHVLLVTFLITAVKFTLQ